MNRDELIRRISEALDSPDGLEGDLELQRLFVRDPAASDLADELASVDRALRQWPEPSRSEQAWEALATRIEQRLDEPLPAMADPTAPPRLSDAPGEDENGAEAAAAAPSPAPATATSSGEFSLKILTGREGDEEPPRSEDGDRFSFSDLAVAPPRVAGGIPSFIDVQPQAPKPPPRRRSGTGVWIGGAIAAAAAVALAVVGGTATLSERGDEPAATAGDATFSAEPALAQEVPAEEVPAAPEPTEPTYREAERAAGDEAIAAEEPASAEAARTTAARRFDHGWEEEREPRPQRRARARRAAAPTEERIPRGTGSSGGAGGGGEATGEPAREDAETEEGSGTPPAAADPESLPETPDRDSIVAVMRAVEPLVQACAGEQRGVATVEITVGSSGRVRSALVTGFFSGTPEGSCVARAVRRARFPEFRRPTFSFTYPFQL